MIEFKNFVVKGVEVKDNDIYGYGAAFGNVDRTGDVIMRGAFEKTIMENKGSVIMLANHDKNFPLGRVTEMEEDDYGLKFKGYMSDGAKGSEYKRLMKEGVVDTFSIGYKAIRYKRNEHGGRDIYEAKLYEISPVAIPMNPEAKLMEVKEMSFEDKREDVINRFELLAKNLGDKKLRLENEAELFKLAEEYKSVTLPSEDTAPTEEESLEAKNLDFINAFKDALNN